MAEENEKVMETKTEEPDEVKAEENTTAFAESDVKEEVVFAPIDTPSRKPVEQTETKRKFPVIPVVTAAAVVCVGVCVGTVVMENANHDVPVNTEIIVSISAESAASNN